MGASFQFIALGLLIVDLDLLYKKSYSIKKGDPFKMEKILQELTKQRRRKNFYEAYIPVRRGLEQFKFSSICAIGMFTSSDYFCNHFQSDQRDRNIGCKWYHTASAFQSGLTTLFWIQQMGTKLNRVAGEINHQKILINISSK